MNNSQDITIEFGKGKLTMQIMKSVKKKHLTE